MKSKVYELFVDLWRLVCKYHFHKLSDSEWEALIEDGKRLLVKYRKKGKRLERLYRGMFSWIQDFYEHMEEEND